MPRYRIVTLIDITRTQAKKSDEDVKRYRQQCNFNTLIQAIGLRANVEWEEDPKAHEGALPLPFKGKSKYWSWNFYVEREDLFLEDGNPVGLLEKDLHGVPIIIGLDETLDIDPPAFTLLGRNFNTFLEII